MRVLLGRGNPGPRGNTDRAQDPIAPCQLCHNDTDLAWEEHSFATAAITQLGADPRYKRVR